MKKSTYTTTRFDIGYCGYYVEVVTSIRNDEEFVEFLICQEGYGIKCFALGVPKKNCPEERWEEIITDGLLRYGWVAMFCENIETLESEHEENYDDTMCCGINFDDLQDIIVGFNKHAEYMNNMYEALMKQYPDFKDTDSFECFYDAFNSLGGLAVQLCCEANEFEDATWMVTDDYYVVCDEDLD